MLQDVDLLSPCQLTSFHFLPTRVFPGSSGSMRDWRWYFCTFLWPFTNQQWLRVAHKADGVLRRCLRKWTKSQAVFSLLRLAQLMDRFQRREVMSQIMKWLKFTFFSINKDFYSDHLPNLHWWVIRAEAIACNKFQYFIYEVIFPT